VKTKVSPALIGAFVIGAFAVALIALLAFGGISFFSKPQRLVIYFDESIQGLDLGSPVKLQGVRVGRVVDLNVRYDAAKHFSVVAVVCELSRTMVSDEKGLPINVSSRAELQKLVDRGLRAQLGVLGLATGMLYVELDFMDPVKYPPPNLPLEPKYVMVPSLPSAISEFQTNLLEILNDIKSVDFKGLSVELKGLLVDTRRQLDGLDLQGVAKEWKQAGAQVRLLAADPKIGETLTNLNAAAGELRATLAKFDQQVAPAGQQLTDTLAQAQATLASFNTAAVAARRFIEAQDGLGDHLESTLAQLRTAADAVQRLADFLERNPQALILGRQKP
jgi:paraquat-inducible protein B